MHKEFRRVDRVHASKLIGFVCAAFAALWISTATAKDLLHFQPAQTDALPIPQNGAYTGAYCPDSETHQVSEKTIYDFETMSEKKIVFVHLFVNWIEDNAIGDVAFIAFPSQACEMIQRRGSIPLITWRCNVLPNEGQNLLDLIANGEFDDHLRSWADKIKQRRGLVFLRWGHEMNGDWFPWSSALNGGEKPMPGVGGSPSGPTRFKKAWRHITDIFRIQGATNVRWVWSVYPGNAVGGVWNEIENYWPGDDRVDWISISVRNYSLSNLADRIKWKNFGEILDAYYGRVTKRLPAKPLMLAEWGCANQVDAAEGDKTLWIKDAFKILPKKYRSIKAICWYNDTIQGEPGFFPANFRLDFTPHNKAYAEGIASSYFVEEIPIPALKPKPKPVPKLPHIPLVKGKPVGR